MEAQKRALDYKAKTCSILYVWPFRTFGPMHKKNAFLIVQNYAYLIIMFNYF